MTRDLAGGAAAVLIGAAYLWFAYGIRTSALDDTLGPGGMPRTYGWLLVGLGVVLCLQAAMGRGRAVLAEEWRGQGRRVLWAAGLLGIGIAYLLLVERLGYFLAVALLIAAGALYGGAPARLRVALVGIGGAAALWTVFTLILGVRMPGGLLAPLLP